VALDFSYQQTENHGQDVLTATVTITADGKVYNELDVAAGATVNYTGMAGLPANLKAYAILPSFGGTMTFHYASGADDVITAVANEPVAWNNKMQLAKHLVNANAIASVDFHNTDAADGTVKILVARDDTP